ncbi:hypothetical protein PV336_04525 [Streptomyces sp. MI02-2A]|uniref:hypothetical protein n=1 Tax=unclassified Streptomyces TaxID=2593676 RepID=UPI000A7D204B|nr:MULTISPECIES: hypothetical protein [unclassified Streptomyces]MDX3258501.1 hypothetical protein [Streptomyces sp. MI02-2A]
MDVPPRDLPFPPLFGQFRHVLAGEESRDVDTLFRQDVVDVFTEVLALDGEVRPKLANLRCRRVNILPRPSVRSGAAAFRTGRAPLPGAIAKKLLLPELPK